MPAQLGHTDPRYFVPQNAAITHGRRSFPQDDRTLSRSRVRPSNRMTAFGAIALISARSAARFSWIEAMTGPIGTPTSTSTASESCRLASIVSGTASDAPARYSLRRVAGVTCARNDDQVRPLRPRGRHQRFGDRGVVQRNDQGARGIQMQPPQQLDLRHVAEIDRASPRRRCRATRSGSLSIATIGNLVRLQHRGDRLADPAKPGDDDPRRRVGDIGHQQARVDRLVQPQSRAPGAPPASTAAGSSPSSARSRTAGSMRQSGVQQPLGQRDRNHDEAELAARAQQQARAQAVAPTQAEQIVPAA